MRNEHAESSVLYFKWRPSAQSPHQATATRFCSAQTKWAWEEQKLTVKSSHETPEEKTAVPQTTTWGQHTVLQQIHANMFTACYKQQFWPPYVNNPIMTNIQAARCLFWFYYGLKLWIIKARPAVKEGYVQHLGVLKDPNRSFVWMQMQRASCDSW